MADFTDVEAMRHALALLCRNRATRITGRNASAPNRWRPFTVREPDTWMWFTDDGAWDFIADCLQGGCPITCAPPTDQYPDFAYIMIEAVGDGKRIYMKVAVRPPLKQVVGLSFHYEDPR